MGVTEYGSNQSVSFDFKQEATSINFNAYNRGVVRGGIYSGGKVNFKASLTPTYTYTIEPFVCAFAIKDDSDATDLLVNVATREPMVINSILPTNTRNINAGIPAVNENLYLVFSFKWVKTINNYIDYKFIPDLINLQAGEIVVCRLRGNGQGIKPSIYYDATTYGTHYRGFDNNFTIEGNDGIDDSTNLESGSGRQLVNYSANSYVLNLGAKDTIYQNFILPPLNGEIEIFEKDNLSQSVKMIITLKDSNTISSIDNNFHISYSPKMPISINTDITNNSNYLNLHVTEKGRLRISNGFSSPKTYIIKINLHSGLILNN